jgi:hypothetical protein
MQICEYMHFQNGTIPLNKECWIVLVLHDGTLRISEVYSAVHSYIRVRISFRKKVNSTTFKSWNPCKSLLKNIRSFIFQLPKAMDYLGFYKRPIKSGFEYWRLLAGGMFVWAILTLYFPYTCCLIDATVPGEIISVTMTPRSTTLSKSTLS